MENSHEVQINMFGGNSVFGSNNKSSAFGSTNNGSGLGSAFSSNTNNNIGSNNTNSTGFSFGNNNNNSNTGSNWKPGFGGNTASTGFGNTGNNSGNGGSLFGNNNASSGGLFGNNSNNNNNNNNNTNANTNTSTGLFGNNNNNNNNSNGTGLFGNNAANTSSNANNSGTGFSLGKPATTGGLFGNNTTKPATGGSLFGSGNSTTTAGTGSSLFGNKPATTITTLTGAKPSTGFSFGGNNTSATTDTNSGGLFGNKIGTNNSTTGSGGLFGNNAAQPTQANQSSQSTSLFGVPQPANKQPSFFFSNQQNSSSTNSTINALQLQQQQRLQQQNINNYSNTIIEQLLKIKSQWDPQNANSTLSTYFYNKVPESDVLSYIKPDSVSQEEWNEAMSKRPNNTYIPVKASGFEDLNRRSTAQTYHVAQTRLILKEIEKKTKEFNDKHDLDSTTRITNCKTRHEQLSKKLLVLGCKLSILKSKGFPLSPDEEILSDNFNKLLKHLHDPASLGQLNDMWSRLAVLRQRSDLIQEQLTNTMKVGAVKFDEESEDEVHLKKIAKVLQKQQMGIQYLTEVLEKDDKSMEGLLKKKSK